MSDSMRTLRRLIAIGAIVNASVTGLFVWTSQHARQHNCDNVTEAFDAYTDALAGAFGRAPDDPEVEAFRAGYEPALEECH